MCKVLVAEISGKRPGGSDCRPTEKYKISYDHLIISNNSEGYTTDWDIVNVPDDYMQWYKENVRTGETSWYAPMNRSYAIKYAREHGYDYLVQLDDNITKLEIAYMINDDDGIVRRYREINKDGMMDSYIEMLVCILENTNAGMAGCQLNGIAVPDDAFLRERYCYSLFALDLHNCPDIFHGDFEDDIEYRLKLKEMGIPAIMCCPLRYGKTGQKSSKDETGNRAAYTKAGLKRGETMRKIHGDDYKCGYSSRTASVISPKDGKYFKHSIKRFKVGAMVTDLGKIERAMLDIFEKYASKKDDKAIVKERDNG